MAVVASKSTLVTNADAVTQTLNDVTNSGARLRTAVATVELANGDSIASTYRMFRVQSNWRIHSVRIYCDAITSGAADLGLYQTAANGGAVVDADAYASAVSIASAITTGTEIAFEARDIANIAKKVWEDAGLTEDSKRAYDLALTLTAATTAAGTVSLALTYAID
jgi:hypothetical protein